jgi:heme-degrading monooxygenase HmoA
MTIVKINAITVPADSGDELARRFAARAGAVDDRDGFEGFELLRPNDERTTWLVITRWRRGGIPRVGQLTRVRARPPLGRRARG